MTTLTLDQLSNVTGGSARVSIPEEGGIAGPVGSPTPNFGCGSSASGNTGSVPPWLRKLAGQLGKSRSVKPIPESGGIAGPVGSPTPF
jgi:hypothetical protein